MLYLTNIFIIFALIIPLLDNADTFIDYMPNAKIKCLKCGTFYNVSPSDLNKIQLVYHCDHCCEDFQVEFFDCCPTCHVNIGFVEGGGFNSDMKYVGGILAKTVTSGSLFSGLSKLAMDVSGSFLGKVKDPNGDGQCPICGQRYIRCPICNALTQIPQNSNFTENFSCKNCGQKVAAGKTPHDATKHSKEFYRH